MRRYRTPIIVGLASLALLLTLGGGVLLARTTFADGPWRGGPWHGGHGLELPAELESLRDLPAGERFSHFKGAQVNLTDRDGNPIKVALTPGTATAVSAGSLTLAANDGSTRTFTLDQATVIGGRRQGNATEPRIEQDDAVVVVTLDDGATAAAVLSGHWSDFGRRGFHGPFGWGR